MASKRSKLVTLSIPSDTLSKFPELTAHVYHEQPHTKSKKRSVDHGELDDQSDNKAVKHSKIGKSTPSVKLTLKLSDNSTKILPKLNDGNVDIQPKPVDILPSSAMNSAPGSAGNSVAPSNNLNLNNVTGNKLSTNIRVGVSGLTMNPHIVRNIDTSNTHPGKWAKNAPVNIYEDTVNTNLTNTFANVEPTDENKPDGSIKPTRSKLKSTEISMLDNVKGVISMKDLRGFKDHPQKDEEVQLIEAAKMKGRRVVRSFTGYLMLFPGWVQSEKGTLEKRQEFLNDKAFSQVKNSKDGKNTTKNSATPQTPIPKVDSSVQL